MQGRPEGAAFGDRARLARLAERYRSFAVDGARGESDLYEKLALTIAGSPELLRFISTLPVERRHPNLFLSAVRYVRGVPEDADQLREFVRRDHEAIRQVMLSHSVQTNEPNRCAVLLPLLARLPQPLAIVEVGASAGLCLLPDRYGYDYGPVRLPPPVSPHGRAPIFLCKTTGAVPFPKTRPWIIWRRGLDLNPIDVRSDEAVGWLEALVWPGQGDRATGLRGAVEIARREPPHVVKGDLVTGLAPLLAEAPKNATLVVFHTAVLVHVPSPEDRDMFIETVRDAKAVWISNEAQTVFPEIVSTVPPPPRKRLSLVMQDGVPLAWAGPHGQSLDWFGTLPNAA
jgi:hypothetical protein